jgi:hypothetical protein
MSPLERELESALLQLHRKSKEIKYNATYFKRMLTPGDPIYKGPTGTVKHLLGQELTETSGFERLRKAGKLDWTVEALISEDHQWHGLFEPWEVERARKRYLSARSMGRDLPSEV